MQHMEAMPTAYARRVQELMHGSARLVVTAVNKGNVRRSTASLLFTSQGCAGLPLQVSVLGQSSDKVALVSLCLVVVLD